MLESASHEVQPMQKVIDVCKDKSKGFQVVLIKSIDRFTRGGGDYYSPLKRQLTRLGIALEDMYGVIGKQQINTLEHTGFKYYWSEFNPTQKSEYLEAERAKDEMRDIMSRMIGAEIRYTQLGYWMRRPHYGFRSVKIDTKNGRGLFLNLIRMRQSLLSDCLRCVLHMFIQTSKLPMSLILWAFVLA